MLFCRAALASAIFAIALVAHAGAVTSDSAKFSHGSVTLFTDASSIQPGTEFTMGVHFTLEPRWHIYWVNSGDSGEPLKIDWQLPRGISAGQILWPVPSKLGSATVVDYGYEKDATLLVRMRADSTAAVTPSATFAANLRILICSNMCLPSRASAKLVIPVAAQPPAPDAVGSNQMREARARLPQMPPAAWRFSATETKDSFNLTVKSADSVSSAHFFPLEPSQVDNAAQQQFRGDAHGFQLALHKSDELSGSVSHLKGVLVLSGGKAYEIDAPVQKSAQ